MRIIRYLLGEISRTNQLTAIGHRLQQPFVIPKSCLCSQIESKVPTIAETQSQQQPQTDDQVDSLYSRLVVETRGHDAAVLKSYEWFALEAAKRLEIPIHNTWVPRPDFYRRNALKSIHIYKKHMVQYEFRTYFRVIELKYLTGSTADTYLEYIQRNLPEGVGMKVTKTALERLPAHIKPPVKQFSTVK